NVAVIFGLALIPIVGAVGAGVDYSRANSTKSHMQAAADSAALFAATGSYSSDSQRITAGVNAFNVNYLAEFGTASPSGTVANGTVTVTASASVPTTVLAVVGITTLSVNVTSVVHVGGSTPTACVLALQTSNDGIFVHGSSSLKANCGLYANSTSSNAIDFDGDSITSASSICMVGHYLKASPPNVPPKPQLHCPAM